jgi:hypothetical protein
VNIHYGRSTSEVPLCRSGATMPGRFLILQPASLRTPIDDLSRQRR